MMGSLVTWVDIEKTTSVVSATKKRGVWKEIIAKAMEQGNR